MQRKFLVPIIVLVAVMFPVTVWAAIQARKSFTLARALSTL